jgi:hypothetical protein
MKRINRDRHLTPEESAKYDRVRQQVDEEWPEIETRIRAKLTPVAESAASNNPTSQSHCPPKANNSVLQRLWASIVRVFRPMRRGRPVNVANPKQGQ